MIFFLFYKKNKINVDILTNILFNDLNKNIPITELKQEIILYLIDKYKETDDICKKFKKTICKSNQWDIEEIYQFLNFSKNFFIKLSEIQIDIIENTLKETHFNFNEKNNKGETLFDIFKINNENDFEYKIKQLGLPIESENERTLNEIFSELLKKNSTLLLTLDKLREIYYEMEYEFHKERGKDQKPIEKRNKEDILKWVNSEETKDKINKDSFIPELLSVIS